jgi:hypothetical protein
MPPYSLSEPAVFAFVLIPLVLAALFVRATWTAWHSAGESPARARRAAVFALLGSALWMAATWMVASRGLLLDWQATPPPFALFVLAIFALAVTLSFSRVGRLFASQIPLWMLVGVQAFRFPLELAMHRMYERGIMPGQMSYSGRSFDILTGITAIVVALLVRTGRGGRPLVLAWNLMGLGLLANILVIAILSTPRFAYFGPDRLNVFVMYPPFVWLPAVMVLAALAGHLIIFRALGRQLSGRPGRPA